jgi:phosphohistidine phosphatase SixA
VLILVRHGHAEDRGQWNLPDIDLPLSERGWQQAEGLAENLAGLRGARLLASTYVRSHQTLTPLANRSGSTIETHEALGHPVSAVALDEVLADPALEGAVVCLHGDTVTSLIQHWLHRASVQLIPKPAAAPQGPTEEGGAWIVVDEATGRSAHYLRPLHVGPVLGFDATAQDHQDHDGHRDRRSSARHLVSTLLHHGHGSDDAGG